MGKEVSRAGKKLLGTDTKTQFWHKPHEWVWIIMTGDPSPPPCQ